MCKYIFIVVHADFEWLFSLYVQDMKCTGMQYLEAIRNLRSEGFSPLRSIHITFVPDEEIGGQDGFGRLVSSPEFQSLNVGVALDEGEPSEHSEYRIFHGERSSWWLVIRALGEPGHGSKLYDNSAIENLQRSMEVISRFRAAQFDLLKAGIKVEGEIISINTLFLKAGSATPMVYSSEFIRDNLLKNVVILVGIYGQTTSVLESTM
jgi:aminoacylase